MDDWRVCAPQLAESDAQNNTSSAPCEGSVTDADKVINTNTGSTELEGVKSDEDLLRALLADDYCHVCEAVLLFESQRLSHYEGKKHAHRVRVYLQAKRAEKAKKEDAVAQRTMTTDKDRFCELCNMVFSSHVVAKSHYEGKVHAKNIRKQGFQTPVVDRHAEALPADDAVTKSAQDGATQLLDPPVSTSAPCAEMDPKDPNKYCPLCAATFNNAHMALQHYNGRKHQRNLSRQVLLKGVKDHIKEANGLMCQICGVQLNSVEMFQAHMQGNKHLSRQKKVIDLCKTQQKGFGTFADELSDYIQIQKARGINPRLPAPPPKDAQQEENSEREGVIGRAESAETTAFVTNVSLKYNSPRPSLIGCSSPAERRPPPHLDPPRPSRSLDCYAGSLLPLMRRKRRKPSASSSSSSYSSSDSSSTSDSEDSEDGDQRRRRARTKRPKREGTEENSRKWLSRENLRDSEERRRKPRESHGRQRGQDRRRQVEDAEPVLNESAMDSVKSEDVTANQKDTEEEGGEADEPSRHKGRREKKKIKGEVDTRTEEERLWDDSILGF